MAGVERIQTESSVLRERREKRRNAYLEKYGGPLGGLVDEYAYGVNRHGEQLSEAEVVSVRQELAREVNKAITDGGFKIRSEAFEALLEAVDIRSREAALIAVDDLKGGL